jgi:mRNA interferase MazF
LRGDFQRCPAKTATPNGCSHHNTVVPITTWQEKFDNDPLQIFLEAHASNGLEKDSSADSTQVRTVALERFDTLKGIVTEEELEAMVLAVGLVIQHP